VARVQGQRLLRVGADAFAEVEHYATHPLLTDQLQGDNGYERQASFGVKCTATGRRDTGDVPEGSTAVVETAGCDGVPGGSGGPLLVSRDGSTTYNIVGVANSYRPDTEFNNYTRIEGAFAKHLAEFVDLVELTASGTSLPATSVLSDPRPWLPMTQAPRAPTLSHIAKADRLSLRRMTLSEET